MHPWDWGQNQARLYEDMSYALPPGFDDDRFAQALYENALFNWDINTGDRHAILDALKEHMADTYGVNFDSVFDWEGYREAYDRGAS